MQAGDNDQDPRPEENDETPGPETDTEPQGENWAAHRFTARTTEDPDDPDGSGGSERSGGPDNPPKIGATPS
jgi:hypothetical protein